MKQKILSLLLVVSLVFAGPAVVNATESFADSGDHVLLPKDQVVDHDYFSAGETVVIEGVVNGDAYIAGSNVIMSGVINGDLLVAGQFVEIRGNVTGDVRAVGENIMIYGTVGGNMTAGGKSIELKETGSVAGSIVAGASRLALAGPVGKSITAGVGTMAISNSVGGDVTYWSDHMAATENASISGNVTKKEVPHQKEAAERGRRTAAGMRGGSKIFEILSLILIGSLALRYLRSAVHGAAKYMMTTTGRAALVGLGALVVLPIALLLTAITVIGFPITGIILMFFIVMCMLAKVVTAYVIGTWVMGRAVKKFNEYGALALGAVLYVAIVNIPVVGWISGIGLYLIALGSSMLYTQSLYRTLSTRKKI